MTNSRCRVFRLSAFDSDWIQGLIDGFLATEDGPCPADLEKALGDERSYLFLAVDDKQILGFCLAYRFPSIYYSGNMAYLYDIDVLEEFWQQGIGTALMAHVKAALAQDDVVELWLGTATDNAGGQALFSKTGAEKSDETFNDFTYDLRKGN